MAGWGFLLAAFGSFPHWSGFLSTPFILWTLLFDAHSCLAWWTCFLLRGPALLVVDRPAFLGVLPGHIVLALLLVFPALALLPAYFALDTGCVRLISLMWLEDVIPIPIVPPDHRNIRL